MFRTHAFSLPVRLMGLALLVAALLGAASCSGDDGAQGPPGPPGENADSDTDLSQGDSLPGLVVTVQSVTGGTGSGGHFLPGNVLHVNYRVQKSGGGDWKLDELGTGRAIVSGPTFNYQRVIAEKTDLLTASVVQADGSFTYTFAAPIPAAYLAPINDSPAFGPEDGEMTGDPLLEGTYTVGLTFSWDYTIDGESERDSGNATFDFVIGNSGAVEARQVVKIENCNRCHDQLRVHGGRREEVTLCVLCHTSGAESDTAGVSIDFKVMIHKIHAGEHLPSVLGVTTDMTGARVYSPTGQPYVLGGNDFSHVAFPAWPHGLVATPRDQGYSALSATDKATEDTIRTGPSNCVVCHGDPDGDTGPLTAPTQGDLYQTQPSRQACGSCHDDVHWGQSYVANGQMMGAQANNSNCKLCHDVVGTPLAVFDAHLHPLLDPTFDTGTNLDVTSLVEAGTNNGDSTFDPGEKFAITFSLVDDAGMAIAPSAVANLSVVISGPTSNYNLLLNASLPTAALTGAQPFTVNIPMQVQLERLGVSTGAPFEVFQSDFTPQWNVTGALTSVRVRTGNGAGNSTLSTATVAPQNYVDVASAAGFARDAIVVVDDGGPAEEYAKIQFVEGQRLWFSSPNTTNYKAGLANVHAAGAIVRSVTTSSKTIGMDYALNASAGTITEIAEFGPGVVLADYTTDFVLPATFPLALNDSPDLGDETGKWTGKPLVDGTYSLGIWTSRTLTLNLYGESNSYKSTSDTKKIDFLVGSAATIEPYALIASGSSCFNCHQELAFHGFGRRDFDSCVLCHGTAGSEDKPQYVAGNAPDTTGLTISFRTMLHKIHMGERLTNASTYEIVGFGSGAYPNNFAVSNFEDVVFPSLPGGVANCVKCHGNDAWHEPQPRAHPTDQDNPVRRWAAVCASCHDSSDAQAHISVQTDALGNESCGVCHGPGDTESVEKVHASY